MHRRHETDLLLRTNIAGICRAAITSGDAALPRSPEWQRAAAHHFGADCEWIRMVLQEI